MFRVMLVAQCLSGERVEAARDLPDGTFACPHCSTAVILKRGRVKVAHFAHAPGAVCDWARESATHLLAKRVLADQFRALGYTVNLEESHPKETRRVDVAVTVPSGHRVAVEIQDSAISVAEMKRRNAADRRSGFFGTVWVFTSARAYRLMIVGAAHEVRVPDEMRWLANRYGLGIFVINERDGQMWRCQFGAVVRDGGSSEWYTPEGELTGEDYPSRMLRTMKTVTATETGFALTARRSRYDKPGHADWAVVFTVASCM